MRFAIGVLLMLAAAVVSIVSLFAQRQANEWVSQSQEVTRLLRGVFSQLQDTEIGQRGYVITGDERSLAAYNRALRNVAPALDRLGQLTSDDPPRREHIVQLRILAGDRLRVLQQGIEVRRTRGLDAAAAFVSAGRGKRAMDRFRSIIVEMEQEQSRVLAARKAAANSRQRWLLTSSLLGWTLGFLMVMWAGVLLYRQRRTTLKAHEQLRQSQQRLRSTELRYRRLFEASSDGVLLVDPATYTITDANPFMEEMLGYSHEQLVGKELWELGLLKDARASRLAFEQLRRTGHIRYEDLLLQAKTGQPREVEFVSNLHDENGRPVIQCNIRDITARKRAEQTLRESEIRYRTLFESIDEGFCVIEVIFDNHGKAIDYRFLETSPSFEKQTGIANARGKRMRELAPKHEEHWFEIYGQIAKTGQPVRFQNRAEQLRRWYDVYAFRFGEAEKRQVAILFNDITERKLMEEALQAANRELTDFATIVSHDLKSPLRAVSTLASWMQSDYADKLDAPGRDNLAEMVGRVARMDRMIDDILTYSRLGRVEAKPEPVALVDLVPAVVQDLAPPAHVQIDIAGGLPAVSGEPVRLRQVFQNLISNAIKHGDKQQTHIRVDWVDSGTFWQFSVTDNGPGIDERQFDRIFRMFHTLSPKDKTDATGVGLALVKRIVELATGRVWVESRPGQGSTFHFTWPKAEGHTYSGALTLQGRQAHNGE